MIMVLFVPVRYKIRASYDEAIIAGINISYLLHIISVSVRYEGELRYKIRIFGIPIKLKTNRPDKSMENTSIEAKESETGNESVDDAKVDSKQTGKFSIDKLSESIDLLKSDNTRHAFDECKKRLSRLLKALFPYKCDIEITYGLDNPAITGMIMGIYEVFLIYLNKSIKLYPIYDKKQIAVKAYIKGKIVAINIIWQALCVLLNKNCRVFYKTIRNNQKKGAKDRSEME